MRLSSHLTHVLVLTYLNKSLVTLPEMPQDSVPVLGATCWGPLMDRNLVVQS